MEAGGQAPEKAKMCLRNPSKLSFSHHQQLARHPSQRQLFKPIENPARRSLALLSTLGTASGHLVPTPLRRTLSWNRARLPSHKHTHGDRPAGKEPSPFRLPNISKKSGSGSSAQGGRASQAEKCGLCVFPCESPAGWTKISSAPPPSPSSAY